MDVSSRTLLIRFRPVSGSEGTSTRCVWAKRYLWGMVIGRRVVECEQCTRGGVDVGSGRIKAMVNEPMNFKRRIGV